MKITRFFCSAALLFILTASARGGWFDGGWGYRRPIDVGWNAEHASGEELAVAEFYTAGHALPNGADVRVTTDEGRVLPSRVLMTDPGDRLSVVFALVKPVRKYYVYFGNRSPAPPPKGTEDVGYKCGIFVDMHAWEGGLMNNAQALEIDWERNKKVIGRTFIDTLFLGVNPFEERSQVICKMRGSYFAPMNGQYLFAGAAHQRAALYIDGKEALFIPGIAGDIRFNTKIDLKRGRHEVAVTYVCGEGELLLSVACQRPDQAKPELIGRECLGQLGQCTVGPLEEHGKTLTADFKSEYAAECFYANHFSYRYQFTGDAPKAILQGAKYEWDFGDGQTAAGGVVNHVYLTDGDYPVKLTVRLGGNSDTQTTSFPARRDRKRIVAPTTDDPGVQSAIVAKYDLAKVPAPWWTWATLLHQRARAVDPMLAAADRVAKEKTHASALSAMEALRDATHTALAAGKVEQTMALWDAIPAGSDLEPTAVRQHAQLLLWRTADFPRAVQVLEPVGRDPKSEMKMRRLLGDALVLAQKADEGRKILEALPIQGPPEREAAISGAMARTVEFFINQEDWESGEEAWEKWQDQYPADFMGGYSVLLETRLMELKKAPEAAARLAEAFAMAVPRSSYAPRLLDRASKLTAYGNPERSKTLRQLLKTRYPEDPLSQD